MISNENIYLFLHFDGMDRQLLLLMLLLLLLLLLLLMLGSSRVAKKTSLPKHGADFDCSPRLEKKLSKHKVFNFPRVGGPKKLEHNNDVRNSG